MSDQITVIDSYWILQAYKGMAIYSQVEMNFISVAQQKQGQLLINL